MKLTVCLLAASVLLGCNDATHKVDRLTANGVADVSGVEVTEGSETVRPIILKSSHEDDTHGDTLEMQENDRLEQVATGIYWEEFRQQEAQDIERCLEDLATTRVIERQGLRDGIDGNLQDRPVGQGLKWPTWID